MNGNPLYNKLLERLLSERPDLAPYMELFQEASKTSSNENDIRRQNFLAKYRKLSIIVKDLEEDLDEAMNELDDLAKALGACEQCWGEDPRCPKCRGKGVSGYFMPDKELFNRLVLPAVKKASWIDMNDGQPAIGYGK